MTRFAIFDHENVIIGQDWDTVAKAVYQAFQKDVTLQHHHFEEFNRKGGGKKFKQLLQGDKTEEIDPGSRLYQHSTGKIKPHHFWHLVIQDMHKQYGIPPSPHNSSLLTGCLELLTTTVNLGVLEIMADLRKNGHSVYILSNCTPEIERGIKRRCGKDLPEYLDNLVYTDDIYFSHKIELRKPDPEAFLYVLRQNGLKANEGVVVDDKEINIEAAVKLGYAGIHYRNGMLVDDIRRELIKLGYQLPMVEDASPVNSIAAQAPQAGQRSLSSTDVSAG